MSKAQVNRRLRTLSVDKQNPLESSPLKINVKQSPLNIIVDPSKTQDLRNRLFNRGISPMPMPTIKKPKVSNASTSYLRPKTRDMSFMDRNPEVSFLNISRETPSQIQPPSYNSNKSITGFVSAKKLRPSTASRKKLIHKTIRHTSNLDLSQPSILPQAQLNKSFINRHNTSFPNISTEDEPRAFKMMEKLKRRPGSSTRNKNIVNFSTRKFFSSQKLIEKEPSIASVKPSYEEENYQNLSDIDKFIYLIHSGLTEESEFVYCVPLTDSNPYELVQIDPSDLGHKKYYTISSHGVTMFLNASPVEFIKLSDWILERQSYQYLAKIPFFNRFRLWKTCIMWKRNVNRYRRGNRQRKLEDKLYMVDTVYSKLLLVQRDLCCEMEKIKFIDLPSQLEAITLDHFEQFQAKKREESRMKILDVGIRLRDNVNSYIRQIMDKLREEIVSDIANERNYVRVAPSSVVPNRNMCPLYEKMGFPENMSFGQRAALRKECSRFIRFSYLNDFLILNSFRYIFINSTDELVSKIEMLTRWKEIKKELKKLDGEEYRNRKKNLAPLFGITLDFVPVDIPSKYISYQSITAFKAKEGINSFQEFHPNLHLKLENESDEPMSPIKKFEVIEEEDELKKEVIPMLWKLWLRFNPDKDELQDSLVEIVRKGLREILVIERWSRHPDIEDFVTALEEWDDKVAESWRLADDLLLDPTDWLANHPSYALLDNTLDRLLNIAYSDLNNFNKSLQVYVEDYYKDMNIDFTLLSNEGLKNQMESFSNVINMFITQIDKSELFPNNTDCGLIRLECEKSKNTIINTYRTSLQNVKTMLPKLLKHRTGILKQWVNESLRALTQKVSMVDEFVTLRTSLSHVNMWINSKKNQIDNISLLYKLTSDMAIEVKKEDRESFSELQSMMGTLTSQIILLESTADKSISIFRKDLSVRIPEFIEEIVAFNIKVFEDKFLRIDTMQSYAIMELEELQKKCIKLEENASKLNHFQTVLDTPIRRFEELEAGKEALSIRLTMWKSLRDWKIMQNSWSVTPFNMIDVKNITEKAEEYSKVVARCESNLPNCTVLQELKRLVFDFKETMPVVLALRTPMQESHWNLIKNILSTDFEINENFTLADLMAMPVVKCQEEIQAVATQSAQETALRDQVQKVSRIWEDMEIPTQVYRESKDSYILGDIEELMSVLDESCATINMVAGNRYVAALRDEVYWWRDTLNMLQDIMEEWVTYQKNWMYLENIFSAPDIKRQLMLESQMFETVDKFFKKIMNNAVYNSKALKATVRVPNILENLRTHNSTLDQIMKQLNKYLEMKRGHFPRFYFLSDDELLEILAQAQNPKSVQPHLKKCFDAIHFLEFGTDLHAYDIIAMISAEGERIEFSTRNMKARGNVEDWLMAVQNGMIDTLEKEMKKGRDTYDPQDRKSWVLSRPAQVVATISQVFWCMETEEALKGLNDNAGALEEWMSTNMMQLEGLTELVRGSLNDIERKTVVALITQDVHGRDIIKNLYNEEVEGIHDFTWQQQLRYYWDDDSDVVIVRQINSTLAYGYEYQGATSRLVITPLTDRCWITITSALHLKLGAAPAGPAGTGKTESTKDLAKALGIQCVVFNCSEQITYKTMERLFSGLVQQGAWSCLDEFNRIDIEVLSVIAQQLLSIRNALLSGLNEFEFEGNVISIKSSCGIFVTMNPTYAGRTELPDNLKVCFRPVSMMIPDYGLIAEIMLYAEGFSKASELSKKMVQLYKLSSEQLSQQDHYDFGMRAVKSVLVMAGQLKRAEPAISEDTVLIRAMRDSNLPKFVAHDIPLFEALIKDLFPKVEIPTLLNSELEKQLFKSSGSLNLQPVPDFLKKSIQLFDTFMVRFGVMLVGPTGSGKSCCYKTLAHAMSYLRQSNSKDKRYQQVEIFTLNPKCITMGELYGEVNKLTQDWRDGLASNIIRTAAADETEIRKWIVFDGPVDSLWIENMNTVLDDNMMLCLANGSRIKLRHQMRILFEVQDLAVASPATVSRCGMVYLPKETLGWKVYIKSWIAKYFESEEPEVKIGVWNLFENSMEQILKRTQGEVMNTVWIQRTKNTCNFMEALLDPELDLFSDPEEKRLKVITYAYVFAVTWGVGGGLKSEYIELFSDVLRQIFSGNVRLPISGTVFDYYMDGCNFKNWQEMVPDFTYDPFASFHSIIVPTGDTVRYNYLLSMLCNKNKSVLFTGETGVGKTIMINSYITKEKAEGRIEPVIMNFSAQTSSQRTQLTIENKLERKSKGRYAAVGNKRILIFIDDVNMPSVEIYGAQPPIELLRQIIDHRGFYDKHKLFWKHIDNFNLVCAAAPPGGGRNELTSRFLRHFNIFSIPQPNKATLYKIFGTILSSFLEYGFSEPIRKLADPAVNASIEVYNLVSLQLKPTPSKFHYMFNLRDVSKVFQGMLMVSPKSTNMPDSFVKLWIHETCRVFKDRLINTQDEEWFTSIMTEQVNRSFRLSLSPEELFETSSVFTDLLTLNRDVHTYEQVTDFQKLVKFLNDKQDEYNSCTTAKLNLVFFKQAVLHTLRLIRVLRQPRGNIMLIGVGGSGKQTLAKLASFIMSYSIYVIEITRNYGLDSFREDLKKMMDIAGVRGKPLSFIMTDSQIAKESFLEDINAILNTGEVTGLFLPDETNAIIDNLREEVVNKMRLPDSQDVIFSTFVKRVRENLHIVLCMSPVGDTLRLRCRKFPSLINCATLDWFSSWPGDALLSVASQFFKEMKASDGMKDALSQMCMEIHTSVEKMAERFYLEVRRKVYITPKSFLDMLKLFLATLETKKLETYGIRDKLDNGLKKLKEAKESVNTFQEKLKVMAPELEVQKKKTEEYYVELTRETQAAEIIQTQVERDKEFVNLQMLDCRAKADEAERDLAEAMPALDAAMRALDSIDKKEIGEMKKYPKPPAVVQMVLEAVCILLDEKTDWPTAQVLLGQMDFIAKLKNFNKEEISDSKLRRLRHYIAKKDFDPDIIGQRAAAARSLCMWCIAMSKYSDSYKIVKPKKEKLALIQAKLDTDMAKLQEKEIELKIIQDKVQLLQIECGTTEERMTQLRDDISLTQKRLERAELLIDLLADEGIRWQEDIVRINGSLIFLTGNVFLSAGCISYLGPFSGIYRKDLVSEWNVRAMELKIRCADDFSLENVLGVQSTIRDWQIAGLPSDTVSTENAIIATSSSRWPLMIDPQMQAHSWIKSMEKSNELKIIRLKEGNSKELIRILQASITNGKPVLLEEVGETLDPVLDSILARQTFRSPDGRKMIRLGDSDISYDSNFKLYITTKLANPHYLPEISIQVSLINFTVTFPGLEEQLLAEVVQQENSDVEAQKDDLIRSMATYKKELHRMQDKILQSIAESYGSLVDDVELISIMQSSKRTSNTIEIRVQEAAVVEETINKFREQYRSVATRGALLYFVVSDLSIIDPMYQYSLEYIKKLFISAIVNSSESSDINIRSLTLIDNISRSVYVNISRGLFESHKALFSFLICSQISRKENRISDVAWNLVLRGPGLVEMKNKPLNPFESLKQSAWDLACTIKERIEEFKNICEHMLSHKEKWLKYAEDPIHTEVPLGYKVTEFNKLLFIKIFRPELILHAMRGFIRHEIGELYTESPGVTMDSLFKDSDCKTPIIFVLSQGADPTNSILKYAKERGVSEKFTIRSLGQDQGPKAKIELQHAMNTGGWLLLQNCHLAKSWMSVLEKEVERFREETGIHSQFRLILTSMPATYFPVSVLQNGLKITTEPPRGIRANLKRNYGEFNEDLLNESSKPEIWRKMLFGLCFFHSVVQERRKFGPLGFNIRYEFNDSDLDTSIKSLKMFLDENIDIPWDALTYITGHIHYGGRVTDDWDRTCLLSALRRFYTPDILEDTYKFSSSGIYYPPNDGSLELYRNYINSLPYDDNPEVFWLHENANITFQNQESEKLLNDILLVQPRIASNGGFSNDEIVMETAVNISKSLPDTLDGAAGHSDLFIKVEYDLIPSLSTVLLQEIEKFNRLTTAIRRSLGDIQKAIMGEIVMSEELDHMYMSILNSQVPNNWKRVAYPSLKPLASWIRDLRERIGFMSDWLKYGNPSCYWLSGFFYPQSFMTGILQTHSRRYGIPIDHLKFSFNVTDSNKDEIRAGAYDGVYIYGLILEGAIWDRDERQLADSHPKELYSVMPVIHFLPSGDYEQSVSDYPCPVYKTSVRAGELSTTGQSTNFILAVDLPTDELPEFWTLRGTALLCQLND